MHAERLNLIARDTVQAFDRHEIIPLFDNLINSVNQRISNPSERSFDEQISIGAQGLFERLSNLEVKDFPPTWRKLMSELDCADLQPEAIRAAIEEAFSTRLVDSDLLQALRRQRDNIASKLDKFRKLVEGLTAVGIKFDDLAPEAIEFDVAMPRESIDDKLSGFNKELGALNRELLVLTSIARDPGVDLRINSISTNDFTVGLSINVDLGEIIAFVLVALTSMRLGYRSKLDALKNSALKDLPEALRKQIEDWAKGYVKEEVVKIVDRLPDECPQSVDSAKLENNKGPVAAALEYFEAKQELGFNMDVRVGPPGPEGNDAGEDAEQRKAQIQVRRERLALIERRSADLKVLTRQSKPILEIEHDDKGAE